MIYPTVLHTSPQRRSRVHPDLHTSPQRKIQGSYLSPPYFALEKDPGPIPPSSILHPRGRSRVHSAILHTSPYRKIQGLSRRPPYLTVSPQRKIQGPSRCVPYFTLEEGPGSIPLSSIFHSRGRSRVHPAHHTSPSTDAIHDFGCIFWTRGFVPLEKRRAGSFASHLQTIRLKKQAETEKL